MGVAGPLPEDLAELIADFAALPPADRLELLVDLGRELPELPHPYASQPELLEAVVECQAPVRVRADIDDDGAARLHISAPPQAPTTRGFAGLLHSTLDGLPAAEVLGLPADLPTRLGLEGTISPLRLNGMTAMLGRIQRQLREQQS